MAENQNYTELKEWAKHFLQVVTSDDLYYGIFLLIALLISLKAIDLVFRPFRKKNVIYSGFLKGVIQAFLIITIGMKINVRMFLDWKMKWLAMKIAVNVPTNVM
jgi:hypothetical protein